MKRYLLALALFLAVVSFAPSAFCADQEKEEKVSTTITIKNDWVFPNSGESFDVQRLSAYWHYRYLGGGFDLNYGRKGDYIQVKPYLTLNKGPWYLVGGFSADNYSQYVQTGFWYVNTFDKLGVFLDVRNYFGVGGKSDSYLDNFLELTYPLGKKFYVGVDLIYDHWWQGSHDWALVGPLVGYKFTDTVSAFVRVSHEWDMAGKTSEANCVRLGLTFKF